MDGELDRILEQCSIRWLDSSDIERIYDLLNQGNRPMRHQILQSLPHFSSIGSVFLIQNPIKKWKKDGFKFEKRPSGRGFKESSTTIGQYKSISCLYSKIDQSDPVYDNFRSQFSQSLFPSKIMMTLKDSVNTSKDNFLSRRIISLKAKASAPTEKLYIVQYFIQKQFLRPSILIPQESEKISLNRSESTRKDFSKDTSSFGTEKPYEIFSEEKSPKNCSEGDSFDPASSILNHLEHDKVSLNSEHTQVRRCQGEQESSRIIALESQVKFLMARLSLLEKKKNHSEDTQMAEERIKLRITDFSPDWSFLKGGAKVIICFESNQKLNKKHHSMSVAFGDSVVPATFIQDNVLKCYCPESEEAGLVDLNILVNDDFVTHTIDQKFEYKVNSKGKNNKERYSLMGDSEDEVIDRLFKVRLVEKLSDMNTFGFESTNSSVFGDFSSDGFFDDQEGFSDEAVLDCLTRFFDEMKRDEKFEEAKEFINSSCKNSFHFVHYLTKFNLLECLQYLESQGCEITLRTKSGVTPLNIALHYGKPNLVQFLFEKESSDFDKHIGDNYSLHHLIDNKEDLEMFLRKLSLTESISNSRINDEPSVECSSKNEDENEEDDLLFNLLGMLKDSKEADGVDVAQIAEKQRFLQRRRRIKNRKHRQKPLNLLPEETLQRMPNSPHQKEKVNEKVKLIQKNVRGWIRRRHFCDVKYAVKVLERYFEMWVHKKEGRVTQS